MFNGLYAVNVFKRYVITNYVFYFIACRKLSVIVCNGYNNDVRVLVCGNALAVRACFVNNVSKRAYLIKFKSSVEHDLGSNTAESLCVLASEKNLSVHIANFEGKLICSHISAGESLVYVDRKLCVCGIVNVCEGCGDRVCCVVGLRIACEYYCVKSAHSVVAYNDCNGNLCRAVRPAERNI